VSTFAVKLPDVGEGVAEAELISWLVAVGDRVTPESAIAEVMTDKATVEISSPVTGVVAYLRGAPGDVLAVGSEIVGIELEGTAPAAAAAFAPTLDAPTSATPTTSAAPPSPPAPTPTAPTPPSSASRGRVTAAPAVRARARALGLDLAAVDGSGPDGRVVHADLDAVLQGGAPGSARFEPVANEPSVEALRGLRRRIAERLSTAWSEIPHITFVDAVDVTDLEALRAELNRRSQNGAPRLTLLPFLARAMVIACAEQPNLNAHFDTAKGELSRFDAVHIGVATQTDDGLMVPVVRHAEARDLWGLATEIARVSSAARARTASRDELSGSTITITSLGALGGLVTTPIINQPEVAIVGVNKIETRPVWRNGTWEPRQMCNLSSSFDHRIVDGWDAAMFVQRIKALLEMPALLFIDEPGQA
jgi:2-oxoisovalerate dehydrogenase E2 component (dihydrolipoyl transacylase)